MLEITTLNDTTNIEMNSEEWSLFLELFPENTSAHTEEVTLDKGTILFLQEKLRTMSDDLKNFAQNLIELIKTVNSDKFLFTKEKEIFPDSPPPIK